MISILTLSGWYAGGGVVNLSMEGERVSSAARYGSVVKEVEGCCSSPPLGAREGMLLKLAICGNSLEVRCEFVGSKEKEDCKISQTVFGSRRRLIKSERKDCNRLRTSLERVRLMR